MPLDLFNGRSFGPHVTRLLQAAETELESDQQQLRVVSGLVDESAELSLAISQARSGDRLAAGGLLSRTAAYLERGEELPASLRDYMSCVLGDAAEVILDRETASPTRLARGIARALNIGPGRGRPHDDSLDDFQRALAWAHRRDAGQTYAAALEAAAKACNCDESTIKRAVRHWLPVKKGS